MFTLSYISKISLRFHLYRYFIIFFIKNLFGQLSNHRNGLLSCPSASATYYSNKSSAVQLSRILDDHDVLEKSRNKFTDNSIYGALVGIGTALIASGRILERFIPKNLINSEKSFLPAKSFCFEPKVR
jgi:hypothetical protein